MQFYLALCKPKNKACQADLALSKSLLFLTIYNQALKLLLFRAVEIISGWKVHTYHLKQSGMLTAASLMSEQ